MAYKLLLADDSVTIQRVIELTFADEDIRVTAVGDGHKAIASIQADRPDIVLADVGMPERDGYEVAAFIKSNPDLASIPILLLTGAFEPIDEARAHAVGCDGVLVKPFEPQMVINRVKDLLAGRRPAVPWGGTPSSSARQPGSTLGLEEPRTAAASGQGPAAPAGSLEDYFDRLDAAFASMEGAPAAPPAIAQPAPIAAPATPADAGPSPHAQRAQVSEASLPDGIANWDPDLTHDPRKGKAPAQAAVPQPAPPIQTVPALPVSRPETPVASPVAAAPVAAAPVHAEPVTPVPAAAPAAAPLPTLAEAFASLLSAEQGRTLLPPVVAPPGEALIEDIVQKVILRMGDQAVRATVTDIAERLVREEIQRIKSA